MPPTTKDIDIASSGSPTTAAPSADNSGKPQPVALEVPVTVNGARTVEGSDKREPFSESTNTVLVFGHGAVIRLASAVTPGQLLFLTNDKTKKEVVCQVVKSKNYRNVSGYVELEFTETIAGFWGMRFPGERPAAPTPTAIKNPAPVATTPRTPAAVTSAPPVAPPATVPKVEGPGISSLPKRPEPLSQPLSTAAALSDSLPLPTPPLKTETKPSSPAPHAVDPRPATTLPKGPASGDPFAGSLPSSWLASESKQSAPVAIKTPPPTAIDETPSLEELKRESARLQEQFASMLLGVDTASKSASPPPISSTPSKSSIADSAAKMIEMAKVQPPTAIPTPPAKSASPTTTSSLDAEEVKIPSWLEPLARNVATPSHNEIPAREEAPKVDHARELEVQDLSSPSTPQEAPPTPHEEPLSEMESLRELIASDRVPAEKSNKGILIGAIAASFVVIAAGATWYARQPSSAPSKTTVVSSAPAPASASAPAAVQAPAKKTVEASTGSATSPSTSGPILPSTNSADLRSQSLSPTAEPLRAAVDKNTAAELSAYKKLAEPQPVPAQPPVQPQPKKPILGEVHLAAPAVNRPAVSPVSGSDAEPAPALGASAVSSSDALGGGLATSGATQPTAPVAPLPVGGDVKQARLISTVQPIYPMLAKNQHAEGNVQIDALIDANGRVSTMKVVSGPILLRQSAMDALKQWKYQPATLDGKPVATHLTVTLQFHLQ